VTNTIHQWEQFGKSFGRFRPLQLALFPVVKN
jgi:hypothetical protein